MCEEEIIFGPLTTKQMSIFVVGGCVSLLLMYLLGNTAYALPVAASVWIPTGIMLWKHKPKKIELKKLNEFLERKRATLGLDAYREYLMKMILQLTARQSSQMAKDEYVDAELSQSLLILQQKHAELTK
jgi:hypothetical protein